VVTKKEYDLRSYLEQITGNKISERDWSLLSGILKNIEIPKGELVIEEGQICNHIWYLKKGTVRFFENVNGEFRTTHFFMAPSMFTVYHSLITGAPSELNIEATSNLVMEALPYMQLKQQYDQSHMLERVGRIMAEYQFISELNRRRMLLNMDALERYEFLEANQPEVFQKFQLKDIATYIGITPVSLSRLRKYRMERK
jgi:CRP-like cAMP-binding protein